MYGTYNDKAPFDVYVRQETGDAVRLVLKFECREGTGVLGIRAPDRIDPKPSAVYQEGGLDPASLKAGRFVHVMPSGQRQSYALSRLEEDVVRQLPTDAWVQLTPHSEFGFRYLVAPDGVAAASPSATAADAQPAAHPSSPPSVPAQVPMAPELAEAALAVLTPEACLAHLRGEMAKVASLQADVQRLQEELAKSHDREQDLISLLTRWRSA